MNTNDPESGGGGGGDKKPTQINHYLSMGVLAAVQIVHFTFM